MASIIEPPVLHGAKVLLRPFTQDDIDESYIQWLNDPVVVRFSNQRFREHDDASCRRYLQSFADSHNVFLSVRCRQTQRRVGTMTAYFAVHHGVVDVGIMIGDRSVWGQGYGQDAWNTLTHWLSAHPAVRKVTAGTLACNLGMVKIMERSGMHREAVRRKQEIVEGRPEDILYFARFRA